MVFFTLHKAKEVHKSQDNFVSETQYPKDAFFSAKLLRNTAYFSRGVSHQIIPSRLFHLRNLLQGDILLAVEEELLPKLPLIS